MIIYLSSCKGTENDKYYTSIQESVAISDSNMIISDNNKYTETSIQESELLGFINAEDGSLLSVVRHDEEVYDFIFLREDRSELVLSVTSSIMSHCVKHFENSTDFLIVYDYAPGHGCPASIVTIIDGKPCILSEYLNSSNNYPKLYYYPQGDIICMRGIGITSGLNNAIPYYWDSERQDFYPYPLHEISFDELKALDKNNIVSEPDKAISIYYRDNGLVHVNYADITEIELGSEADNLRKIASRTYVQTKKGLREYDFETDACYGFFIQSLCVKE